MELRDEIDIRAPRRKVWEALNDPAVLARCIEGVEQLEAVCDNRFSGTMQLKVGPVKARFAGTVELTEVEPPHRYVLVGEGKGGVAGFVKGTADVRLTDSGEAATRLSYVVHSQVGGRLAQLGARLIEGAARGYAGKFFDAFRAEVEEAPAAPAVPAPSDPAKEGAAQEAAAPVAAGVAPWLWIGAMVLVVLLTTLWLLR